METPLEQQRVATLDVIEAYRDTWLGYKTRVGRTGGFDSKLTLEYGVVNNHMNYLLERYFSLMAGVALNPVQPYPVGMDYDGA